MPPPRFDEVRRFASRILRNPLRTRSSLPAQPTFADAALFAYLTGPARAVTAWRHGDADTAWHALIDHLRQRAVPLGFIAPDHVGARRAEAERRFPHWRARLLAKVQEDRQQGLTVYDQRAAPLSGSFDWSARAAGPMEDRLYGIRPHRFGFVPRWSLACHFDRTIVAELDRVLAGWMAARGPNGHPAFNSSHVVLYNLTALLIAWPFLAALGDAEPGSALHSLRRRIVLVLYEDSRFLRSAAGSAVANNHLLAERFGDWLSAALLPELDHVLAREPAERVWLDELYRQTYPDGGSVEHSIHYQEHVCEMAAAYLLLARLNNWTVPPPALQRIAQLLRFQLAMSGPTLLPLPIGNTTEDPLLPVGVGEGWQSGFLREVERSCFAAAAPATALDNPSLETAFWLLGTVAHHDAPAPQPEAVFQDFPDSGMCVLAEPAHDARFIFRLGPSPNTPSIGGHSHCDLLSVHLSVGGAMLLPPPGTGSYRYKPHPTLAGHPNLRAHFASAASRSALFRAGLEPYGPLRGDFRDWRLPCQVDARRASSSAAALSWIEGDVVGDGPYVGQQRGVVHVWDHGWLVYDRVPPGDTAHPAFVGWQLAPDATCDVDEHGNATVVVSGTQLTLLSCGTGKPTIARGSFDPFRGWVSPAYGRLLPAPNLRFPLSPSSTLAGCFLTLAAGTTKLSSVTATSDGLAFAITTAEGDMVLLVATGKHATTIRWEDNVFQGRVACIRHAPHQIAIRALGLTMLSAPALGLELSSPEPADFEVVLSGGTVRWPRGQSGSVTLALQPRAKNDSP